MLRLSHEKEKGRNAPSELWELRHNYSEGPSGTHQKSKNKITDTSFHQALLAQTAETAARPLDHHHHPELQPELKDAGLTPEFALCFQSDAKTPLILISLPHMGVKNYLSLSSQACLAQCQLVHFPPFFLYNGGLCEVGQRGGRLLFNLKDKWLLVLCDPSAIEYQCQYVDTIDLVGSVD